MTNVYRTITVPENNYLSTSYYIITTIFTVNFVVSLFMQQNTENTVKKVCSSTQDRDRDMEPR